MSQDDDKKLESNGEISVPETPVNAEETSETERKKKPVDSSKGVSSVSTGAPSGPGRLRSLLSGLVLAFVFATVISFVFNIGRVVEKSQVVKKVEDLFIMDQCVSNVFAFMLAGLFIFVPLSLVFSFQWKKRVLAGLFLFGFGVLFFQFVKVPHLQRLLAAKIIYKSRKQTSPFVRHAWKNYLFTRTTRVIDTGLKVSIHLKKDCFVGISNESGRKLWQKELPRKSMKFVKDSICVSGSSFYYRDRTRVFSRKIQNGTLNWKFLTNSAKRTSRISNFSVDKEKVAFYCRNCRIKQVKERGEKNLFFGYAVILDDQTGELVHVVPVRENRLEVKMAPPVVHYYGGYFYAISEKYARFLVVQSGKIIASTGLKNFLKIEPNLKEVLGLEKEKKSELREKNQKAYFFEDRLLFNSPKWIRLYDLQKRKHLWTLDKGFLEESTGSGEGFEITRHASLAIIVEQGFIYAFSLTSGKMVWGPKRGAFTGKPVVVGSLLFAPSRENGGAIYVLPVARGKFLFAWSQHKRIKDLYAWKKMLFFRGRDNLGIPAEFAFSLERR